MHIYLFFSCVYSLFFTVFVWVAGHQSGEAKMSPKAVHFNFINLVLQRININFWGSSSAEPLVWNCSRCRKLSLFQLSFSVVPLSFGDLFSFHFSQWLSTSHLFWSGKDPQGSLSPAPKCLYGDYQQLNFILICKRSCSGKTFMKNSFIVMQIHIFIYFPEFPFCCTFFSVRKL